MDNGTSQEEEPVLVMWQILDVNVESDRAILGGRVVAVIDFLQCHEFREVRSWTDATHVSARSPLTVYIVLFVTKKDEKELFRMYGISNTMTVEIDSGEILGRQYSVDSRRYIFNAKGVAIDRL